MKSELDELIELLEEEKISLEASIKNNIGNFEYIYAHHQSRALEKLSTKLNNLYKLKDPLYTQKIDLQRTIKLYENFQDREGRPAVDNYYQKQIDEAKEKLNKLRNDLPIATFDDQKIDDALLNLQSGSCSGFIFYLNAKSNLAISFERTAVNIIEISLSVKSTLNVDYFWSDEEEDAPLNKFFGLGFSINPQYNKLVYNYNFEGIKDAIAVKTLLSRIVYDVFTHAEFDSPASLVYF